MSEIEDGLDHTLLFTSKGYIEKCKLRNEVEWQDNIIPQGTLRFIDGQPNLNVVKTGSMVFIERYYLDDEVVYQAVHVKMFDGMELGAAQGSIT